MRESHEDKERDTEWDTERKKWLTAMKDPRHTQQVDIVPNNLNSNSENEERICLKNK
jgi:hypothetical protein